MKIQELDLPVKYQPTFDIWDSSKVQAFMGCPRGFFFKHILGWRERETSIHLGFGSAWHDAMETFLLYGYSDAALSMAVDAFIKAMEEIYPTKAEQDDNSFLSGVMPIGENPTSHNAKNVENGIQYLINYSNMYKKDESRYETLYTEVVANVPISEDRSFVMKMDSILRSKEDGKIYSLEHKTTGRKTGAWLNSWFSKFQVRAYAYALKAIYGDEFGGIIINGAVIRSKDCEFIRIPVRLSDEQIIDWLAQANHWMDLIEWNFVQLSHAKPDDLVMNSFFPNTEACNHFGCSCGGACHMWSNPLKSLGKLPAGYKVEFWNPNRDTNPKHTVDVNLKGKSVIIPNQGKQ